MSNAYWLIIRNNPGHVAILLRVIIGSSVIAMSRWLTQRLGTVAPSVSAFSSERLTPRFKLTTIEWQALFQLLIIAGLALPILPNASMGPWAAVNPRIVGYLILLIAGISLVGHFAMRLFGSRVGLLATSAIGGLVSSTAVTLSFARRARQDHSNVAILGAGISLAAAIMAIRVLLEVSVVNAKLLPVLLPPLLCLTIVPLLAAIAIALRTNPSGRSSVPEVKNPLELGSAIFFGLVLAVLSILVRATEEWFGDTGVYILAAISGMTDVDALSLSLAEATLRSLPLQVGAFGILVGTAVNTMVKGILAIAIGGLSLAKWCASILLLALILGAIALGLSLLNLTHFTPTLNLSLAL